MPCSKLIVFSSPDPTIGVGGNRNSHHMDQLKDGVGLPDGKLLRRMVENSPLPLKEPHFNKDPVESNQNWHHKVLVASL